MGQIKIFVNGKLLRSVDIHPGRTYRVGRDETSDITVPVNTVSRRHGELTLDTRGQLSFRDIGSRNGSFVGRQKIDSHIIVSEEKLFLGQEQTTYLVWTPSPIPPVKSSFSSPAEPAPRPLTETPKIGQQLLLFVDGRPMGQYGIQPGQALKIGRGEGQPVDIVVAKPFVSRQHASIELLQDGSWQVEDLKSTNGTYINNRESVDKQAFSPDDKLYLGREGSVSLQVVTVEQSSDSAFIQDRPDEQNLLALLERLGEVRIGRGAPNDIPLSHPTVSREHALIKKVGEDRYELFDLGSRNGIYLNGRLISGKVALPLDGEIKIGPYEFRLQTSRGAVRSGIVADRAAILGKDLITRVPKRTKPILNLKGQEVPIPRGEMIAIMGPSGCGKSTLMNAMNGTFPATSGSVNVLGYELTRQNFPLVKQLIGFVPQDDIVHKNLTVHQCLRYAARLKLPASMTEDERKARIADVLKSLRIDEASVPGILHSRIGKLSGGQRKRVSIAVELLTEPQVLFLDEPTSPLDPQTIDDFLICLRELTRDKGTTIIMVTHKPADLEHMDKVIFMAAGGYMAYYGDVEGFRGYFGVDRVKEVYASLATQSKKGEKSHGAGLSQRWGKSKEATRLKRYKADQRVAEAKSEKDGSIRQTYWLFRRYLNLKRNDELNIALMLGQAPVIAILMCFIFDEPSLAVLFMMAISAIWFGTNNAAREIVGELPIYLRERMFNLQVVPYVLSKLLVLSLFSFFQVIVFVAIIVWHLELDWSHFGEHVLAMFLMSFSATLMGLVISAWLKTAEQVMTVVPIALIPQILLCGVLTSLNPVVEPVSYLTLSRWGTEAFTDIEDSLYNEGPVVDTTHFAARYPDADEVSSGMPRQQVVVDTTLVAVKYDSAERSLVMESQKVKARNMLQLTDTYPREVNLAAILLIGLSFFLMTLAFLRKKDPFRKLQ